MRITTVREFQAHLSGYLRLTEPLVILRYREIVAIVFPQPRKTLGVDLSRELARALGGRVRGVAIRALKGMIRPGRVPAQNGGRRLTKRDRS